MAIAVDKYAEIIQIGDTAFYFPQDDLLAWLYEYVGDEKEIKYTPLFAFSKSKVLDVYGDGWKIVREDYADKWGSYWLHIDNETLLLQFKLTWL
jgi:hypothetical protein